MFIHQCVRDELCVFVRATNNQSMLIMCCSLVKLIDSNYCFRRGVVAIVHATL